MKLEKVTMKALIQAMILIDLERDSYEWGSEECEALTEIVEAIGDLLE